MLSARSITVTLFGSALLFACGASVSKTYESDVRFERCFALDWKQGVDSGIRQRCWEEWVTFYAAGQARDRIEYAKTQMRLISSGEGDEAPESSAVAVAPRNGQPLPEPTSVFGPVPMMSPTASASAPGSAASSALAVPRTACETRCDKAIEGCLAGCGSAVCEQFCAQKHTRCGQRCEATEKPKR